jgi:hypothetical protein
VLLLASCDAAPSDPLDTRADLAALLNGPARGHAAPHTVQGLLHAALHRVYSDHGASAARGLVSELRRLQDEARRAMAASDREATSLRLQAARAEELAIVLRVFGHPVAERVVTGVALDLARLTRAVDESEQAGRLLPRSRELLAQMALTLQEAHAALERREALAALDAATRAAAVGEAVGQDVSDARRIPALAELFDLAAARPGGAVGDGGGVEDALVRYRTLRQQANAAVRTGDRERAHRALEAVRAEQIRIVLDALGEQAAARLVTAVWQGVQELESELRAARSYSRDVARVERMVATARDMTVRARTALEAGNSASALDLASHAAGLINAGRLTLAIR